MKKVLWALSLALTVGFTSCSSDDNGGSGSSEDNFLNVNGNNQELKSGLIIDYGNSFTTNFNYDVSLFTQNFNPSNINDPFGGQEFSEVYFELFTDNADGLPEGTYQFSNSDDVVGTFTDFSEVSLECTVQSFMFDCNEYLEITGGTFTVNSAGSMYDIEFSVTLQGGGTAEGKYVGSLIMMDESDFLMEGESKQRRQKVVVE